MTKVPNFACTPGCSSCCKASLVPFSAKERQRVDAAVPGLRWTRWNKPGEPDAWVLTDQLDTLRCPLLTDDGRCSVHAIRPVPCQIYGMFDRPGFICKHGGKASRKLTDKEARRLMRRA